MPVARVSGRSAAHFVLKESHSYSHGTGHTRAIIHAMIHAREERRAGTSGHDVVALRAEVEALRGELAAKETLLATHRTNVQRWQAEAVSVHEAAAATALQQPSRGELAQNGNAS